MNKKLLRWNFVFQYGYVLTNIFNSILLLPLYLKNIDADTLGIWLATGNILAWMILADPGIGEVLQQKIAELSGKKETNEIGKLIGSGYIASGLILLLSVIIGFVSYFMINVIIDKDVSQYPNLSLALIISIIATGMSLVSFSMTGINQGLHNTAHVAISSLSSNFVFLFTNLALLFLNFGVMSIAIANLCRAVFINIYNISAMLKMLKRQGMKIILSFSHFKGFIKIFSFTSASKIISGLSSTIDMVILARFISPAMITIYEINKRPVNITYSLIGRHSVALMPLLSHAKGSGDKVAITEMINKQFKLYSYAAIFTSCMFCLNYFNLITLWTGSGKFAGNTIMLLLVSNFFFGLIGYFMSNMGYALGDIKWNSLINIARGILISVLMFSVAGKYGIIGTLVVTLSVILVTDFFYFTYRLHKIGFLQSSLIVNSLKHWLMVIPLSALAVWGFPYLVNGLLRPDLYLSKILINSTMFVLFFALLLLITDKEIRNLIKQFTAKLPFIPSFRKAGAL